MALTNKQVRGVCNLFAKAFVNAENEEVRKKILIDFEDSFGTGIVNWKKICGNWVRKLTADETIVKAYESLSTRNDEENKTSDCDIRLVAKEDFDQIREIVNVAFDMMVSKYDEPKFEAFVENGYSFVAHKDEEILGVILAHVQPELLAPYVYINTFAVAEHARGNGIGKALFQHLKKQVNEENMYLIKLQTDPKIEAYEIYKHWGMQESELVMMQGYCF